MSDIKFVLAGHILTIGDNPYKCKNCGEEIPHGLVIFWLDQDAIRKVRSQGVEPSLPAPCKKPAPMPDSIHG